MSNQEADELKLSPEVKAYYADKRLFIKNAIWLLFGTFGMGLGLGVASNLVPIHMDKVGMSATQIALGWSINGWIISVLMIYIAYRSDNCQIKWGRRLPFLLLAIPPVCAALIIFPHTNTILSCVLIFALYRFFLNFKEQTYPFLSYDISPKQYWGRMWALQMAGNALGVWVANVVLMRLVDLWGEAPVFYLAAGLLGILTLVTTIFLKEPPIRIQDPPSFNIMRQLKIGFSEKKNWLLFIGFGLGITSTISFPTFIVLHAKNNVSLNSSQIGWVMSWMMIGTLAISFPAGWLTDKLGAIRTVILGYVAAVIACLVGYSASTATQLSVSVIFLSIGGTMIYNSLLVFLVDGVDRSVMASFCACNGMFSAAFSATMQVVCGKFIDVAGGNYAIAFPFGILVGGIGIPLLIIVSRLRRTAKSAKKENKDALITA